MHRLGLRYFRTHLHKSTYFLTYSFTNSHGHVYVRNFTPYRVLIHHCDVEPVTFNPLTREIMLHTVAPFNSCIAPSNHSLPRHGRPAHNRAVQIFVGLVDVIMRSQKPKTKKNRLMLGKRLVSGSV